MKISQFKSRLPFVNQIHIWQRAGLNENTMKAASTRHRDLRPEERRVIKDALRSMRADLSAFIKELR